MKGGVYRGGSACKWPWRPGPEANGGSTKCLFRYAKSAYLNIVTLYTYTYAANTIFYADASRDVDRSLFFRITSWAFLWLPSHHVLQAYVSEKTVP